MLVCSKCPASTSIMRCSCFVERRNRILMTVRGLGKRLLSVRNGRFRPPHRSRLVRNVKVVADYPFTTGTPSCWVSRAPRRRLLTPASLAPWRSRWPCSGLAGSRRYGAGGVPDRSGGRGGFRSGCPLAIRALDAAGFAARPRRPASHRLRALVRYPSRSPRWQSADFRRGRSSVRRVTEASGAPSDLPADRQSTDRLHKTLLMNPTELEIEMCAVCYGECPNSLISLANAADEALRKPVPSASYGSRWPGGWQRPPFPRTAGLPLKRPASSVPGTMKVRGVRSLRRLEITR